MCTGVRFTDDKGNFYFGRNLDWCEEYGQGFVITPTGAKIPSPYLGTMPLKHPVIGVAIVVDNTPLYLDCANNAGLGVAGLNFPGYAHFADEPIDDTTNIAVYEFPLWLCANFGSIAEVKEALKDVTLVAKPINDTYPVAMLHWLVCDKEGSLVVEATKEGIEVYDDELDVLTNQPGYPWHRENVRNYLALSNSYPDKPLTWSRADLVPFSSGSMMLGLPGAFDPISRFVRASYLNAHYPTKSGETANVMRLFHTLGGVAMCEGGSRMSNNQFEYTLYSDCYSMATGTYYYKSYDDFTINQCCINDYDVAGDEVIVCK